MMSLDYANRNLYERARERDRQLWLAGSWRAYRDALMLGCDGKVEWEELCRRDRMIREAVVNEGGDT